MRNAHGQLIVLDGADAVGKKTQTGLLVSSLRGRGIPVAVFDFPRYEDSVFGKLLKRSLRGEFGDFKNLSPYLSSWLYTLDRAAAKYDLEEALARGLVLCNRYVPSNIAYQAAKLPRDEQNRFIELLEEAEYDELVLPYPKLVIYLSVPAEVSQRLLEERGQAFDQHESDLAYQRAVSDVYRRLAEERADWEVIPCAPEGVMLSREEIHRKVLNALSRVVNHRPTET